MAPYWRALYNNSIEGLISDLNTLYPLFKEVSSAMVVNEVSRV